jgi:Uncharacterized protein conserved in bacteria (DUF2188)
MATVKYEIVQHDNGWAYRVQDTFSETFRSHDGALAAAKQAAAEQQAPDDDTEIEWEDQDGKWHTERSPGNERPSTEIADLGRPSRRDRP